MLRLYVWARAQVLLEAADGTADELVLVCGERYDGHEAQGEEGPLRDAACAPVAAVVALRSHAFVAFKGVGKVWEQSVTRAMHLEASSRVDGGPYHEYRM